MHNNHIFIAISILWLFAIPVRAIDSVPDPSSDNHLEQWTTSDGSKLADRLYKSSSDLKDYKVESTLFMCKPALQESGGGTLFFKKPNLVRLQIKSRGMKNGTVVVRQPDGRIRLAGGPKLRFLKMNLDEDSRMLQAPNGLNIVKADFATLFASVNAQLLSGSKALATREPVNVDRLKKNVTVLELVKAGNGSGQITDRIFIDPTSGIPLEWDLFRGGALYSVNVFENFDTNLGLQDDQFKL